MKAYQIYFFTLKFIILFFIILKVLKIIPDEPKIFIIIDLVFKVSLGLFLIIFFAKHKVSCIDPEDRLLIIVCGFILLLIIDYKRVINKIFNTHLKDTKII